MQYRVGAADTETSPGIVNASKVTSGAYAGTALRLVRFLNTSLQAWEIDQLSAGAHCGLVDVDAPVPLFTALQAVIAADAQFSGLRGYLAIGVAVPSGSDRWWHAEFGTDTSTWCSTTPPSKEPDTTIVLSMEAAERLLQGETLPPDEFTAFGNLKLLQRFRRRYLERTTGLGHHMMRLGLGH